MEEKLDRRRYVVRMRKGKPILVDKAILRWRKKRKKALQLEQPVTPENKPSVWIDVFGTGEDA